MTCHAYFIISLPLPLSPVFFFPSPCVSKFSRLDYFSLPLADKHSYTSSQIYSLTYINVIAFHVATLFLLFLSLSLSLTCIVHFQSSRFTIIWIQLSALNNAADTLTFFSLSSFHSLILSATTRLIHRVDCAASINHSVTG